MRRSEAKHNRDLPPSQRRSLPCLVNRLPLLPRPDYPFWTRHPVPVASGEVSKLCRVEQGEAVGNPEVMPVVRPWPVTITPSPDHHLLSGAVPPKHLLAELNGAIGRLSGFVFDLCVEYGVPPEEVDRRFPGSDPGDLPSRFLSDYQRDMLIRFRGVSRNR